MALLPGFRDTVFDSQRVFRTALTAMARPGQPQRLDHGQGERLEIPCIDGIHAASLAWLLALADIDTPVWIETQCHTEEFRRYLRFHTGAEITPTRQAAYFGLFREGYDGAFFADFPVGSDDYPNRSATLIIQVADLTSGPPRTVRGPGIRTTVDLCIAAIAPHFWDAWRANQALYPCGVDVVFTAGDMCMGLPRSITEET